MELDVFKYNLTDAEKKWLDLDTSEGLERYERVLASGSEFGKLSYVAGLLAFRGEKKKAKALIEASSLDELEKMALMQDVYFDVLDEEDVDEEDVGDEDDGGDDNLQDAVQ